jgi:hypothetical protein
MFNLFVDMESVQSFVSEDSSLIYYDIYIGNEQMTTEEGYPFSLELDLSEKNMAFINPHAFDNYLEYEEELFERIVYLLETEKDFIMEETGLTQLSVNYVDNSVYRYEGDYSHKLNKDFLIFMKGVTI